MLAQTSVLSECDAWGQTHQDEVLGSFWRQRLWLRLTTNLEVPLGAWTWHTLDVGNKGRRKEQSWQRGRDNCPGIAVLDTVWAVLFGPRGEEYSLVEQMKQHSPKRLKENQQEDGTSSQKMRENLNSAEKSQYHKNWKHVKQEGRKKQWCACF